MTPIEEHLLRHGGWVSASELARLFDLRERDLRSRHDKPGICSDFAISGNDGFKHVLNATPAEWTQFEERLRAHATSELRRVKNLRRVRLNLSFPRSSHIFETKTGQGLLIA